MSRIKLLLLVLLCANLIMCTKNNNDKPLEKRIVNNFSYGIVMGYYGPVWSQQVYEDYADFSKSYGYRYFIYAPKQDSTLRKEWREPFTKEQIESLKAIRNSFKQRGIAFGIGLSPYNLNTLNEKDKQDFNAKIDQINEINPDILGIFFDDIDRSAIIPDLGSIQVKIAEYVAMKSTASEFITVPTYYSDDKILTRVLGEIPKEYYSQFGTLSDKFEIMWTGTNIISSGYSKAHMQTVEKRFSRKVVIWDNYPVNDPYYLNDYLRIYAFTGRPKELSEWTKGVAINPMVQPYMSMIPLATAKDLYGSNNTSYVPEASFNNAVNSLTGEKLGKDICDNMNYFSLVGIKNTSTKNIQRLTEVFSKYTETEEKKFTSEILYLLKTHEKKEKSDS